MAAAQGASERDALRRHRQLGRMAQVKTRMEAPHRAVHEVEEFENHVERLVSVHKECGPVWNWLQIATASPPVQPMRTNRYETKAQQLLEAYVPTLAEKLLGRAEPRRAALVHQIELATRADNESWERAMSVYRATRQDWMEMKELAERILANEPSAFAEAIHELAPLAELTDLGSHIEYEFRSDGCAAVVIKINADAVIPRMRRSLAPGGEIVVEKMPLTERQALYRQYVVGATLRIARELFALLPLETVMVTAVAINLDSSSGRHVLKPILSVKLPRATLQVFRFDSIDPVASLGHLEYRMVFSDADGFGAVEPLVLAGDVESVLLV